MPPVSLDNFSEQTLEMADDYEGRVVATLVRSGNNIEGRKSVLYIHGLNDYFFHTHVAEAFHNSGFNFYALDLRKYGRSLLPHQHPNYCRSHREYYEEITAALEIIEKENHSEITLLGHSTGALFASLYMNEGGKKDLPDALVLNSPFLEFNATSFQRKLAVFFSRLISFFFPYAYKMKPLSHLYNQSLLKSAKGEWEYNLDWKPRKGFPAYLKWVVAIFEGQEQLRQSSDIKVPVLVMHSSKSTLHREWNAAKLESDMVLNIEHMKKYGKRLGKHVDFIEVEDAMHDIFLSRKEIREKALDRALNWINRVTTG